MNTYYINNPSTDIYFNLAAEEFLLKNRSENILMFWQNTPSVILGKHQSVEAEIDLNFVQEKHIRVARRYSGGGTVYHDLGNLNLTFIENTNTPNFEHYNRQTLELLASIGLQAEKDDRLGIYIDRSKISGSAQCIYKTRILYHCTLLYDTNLVMLTSSLAAKPNASISSLKYSVPSVKSPVTNVRSHLHTPPTVEDFKKQALDFFIRKDPKGQMYQLNKEEVNRIERLRNEKYATPQWIFNKVF